MEIVKKSKAQQKREFRDAVIVSLWKENYDPDTTQITPVAESIAKRAKVSLSTVKRIVKPFIKKQAK